MAAIIELYANNAYSTLASSTTTTATTLTVVNGSSFPNPVSGSQFFRMTITGASSPNTIIEIVYVTARSGNTLTVVRGREGTSGIAWSVNDLCANEATAGTYNQFMQPYVGVDTGATNAYVVSTPQHEVNYYTGMPVVFSTLNANTTTAPTLNLNGIGARTIQSAAGGLLAAGDIKANTPIYLLYSAANNAWLIQSPIGYQRAITGAATSIVNLDLTASRALVSDTNGKVAASGITAAELNYLAFATSNIQTQLNYKTDYGDFISSNSGSNDGYQKIAGGLIIQWGSKTFTSGTGTVTFPIAFPNQCIRAYAVEGFGQSPGLSNQPTWYGVDTGNTTRTTLRISALEFITGTGWVKPTSSTAIVCNWFAIGN
jgi:hypothetical protein